MAKKRRQVLVKKETEDFYNKIFQWYGLQLYDVQTSVKDEMIVGKKGFRKTLTTQMTRTDGGTIITLELRRKPALSVGRDLTNDANNLVSFISAVTSRQ